MYRAKKARKPMVDLITSGPAGRDPATIIHF